MFAVSPIDWVLGKLPVIIFILFFVSQMVRGFFKTRNASSPSPTAKPDELAENRRVREVQEEIRRRIAERRGAPPPTQTFHAPDAPLPVPRPETTQMPQPFGGPLRRVFEEIERELKPQPAVPPPPLPAPIERSNAELDRQQRLAAELKSIEQTRVITQRRVVNLAAKKEADSQAEPALRSAARDRLFEDLGEPENLRRAFVLREVLGPPVALR